MADPLPPADDVPPVSAEELVDGETAVPEVPRRYPSTIGGALFLAILLTTVVGLGIVAGGSWRAGIQVIGAALIVAAVLRLLLRAADAGMLAVRHKALDAVLLSGLGGLLIFLARTIPNQPG